MCKCSVVKHVGISVKMSQKCGSYECITDVKYLAEFGQNVSAVQRSWKYATDSDLIITVPGVLIVVCIS